ncbi:gamma-aminobutyric acid receptor subunit beta-2-like [Actinia tenebrosa]|uniref:Gamma-aminobutyric acid receptor subunit beta n=1 Tax=Actinia tenebrosa TaxID=6105 RepID=A0A6P8HE29_ACTTE|nr:gamma-aminobutyric acid receptor subunit beta-2-like [Actinia tenebrosa]
MWSILLIEKKSVSRQERMPSTKWVVSVVILSFSANLLLKSSGEAITPSNNGISASDMSNLLNKLIKNYDKRLRPNFGGDPVVITVGFWILSIDSINVIDMDYKMDFFLRQLWYDPRLKHDFNGTLALGNYMVDKIWIPDTYFENSKSSNFHQVTSVNKMLTITPDGGVHYNSRVTVKASCPMDLRMFPVDIQQCNINIESYGYSASEMVYQWEPREDNGIAVNKKTRDMPQYNLTNITVKSYFTLYFSGNWSRLSASFNFVRRSGYFLIHIYAPCALIVIISWISFCIPPESTAARIALGITSVLTITTVLNMLNNTMPKVSYVKAIDWYLIGCFLFVIGVLVEYTMVLYLENVHNKKSKRGCRRKNNVEEARECDGYRPLSEDFASQFPRLRAQADDHSQKNGSVPHGFTPTTVNKYNTQVNSQRRDDYDKKKAKKRKHGFCNWCSLSGIIDTACLDSYCRLLFPLSFVVFNAIYWIIFLEYNEIIVS